VTRDYRNFDGAAGATAAGSRCGHLGRLRPWVARSGGEQRIGWPADQSLDLYIGIGSEVDGLTAVGEEQLLPASRP